MLDGFHKSPPAFKTNQHLPPRCRSLVLISTLRAKINEFINELPLFHIQVRSGLCSLCHYTCEGLESVHFKGLFADFGQIHFQLWADVILLQAFADLKYFVCDALWSRSWRQSKRLVRKDVANTDVVAKKHDSTHISPHCSQCNIVRRSLMSAHVTPEAY